MKNKHLIVFGSFLITVIAFSQLVGVKKAYSVEETITVCDGERNTIRIYQEEDKIMMRVVDKQNAIVWLNTEAKKEPNSEGTDFFNIRGEQTVRLFVANNSENFCSINIGDLPTEKGEILSNDLGKNENMSVEKTSVTGTVAYLERIALPPGSVIKIKLLDVSLQDAPAKEISSQTITTSGEQVPIAFELTFDPNQIESNHTYAVRSEIFVADQLSFTTTQIYPVITRGNPQNVNLVLQKINPQTLQNQLIGTEWLLEDLGGKGVMDNVQTTLKFFDDNRIGGSGGCNNYFGSYKIDNDVFTVSGIGSTFKLCPEAVMNQESSYFQALEKTRNIRLDGPYLLIVVEGLEQPLKFTEITPKE